MLIMSEFVCPDCGRFEMLVDRPAPDAIECPLCGAASPWTISAPKPKNESVPCYATVRGGDMKDRPPGLLDTRPLAEGQSYRDWRKVQDGHRQERLHHKLIKDGLKSKKIQVG